MYPVRAFPGPVGISDTTHSITDMFFLPEKFYNFILKHFAQISSVIFCISDSSNYLFLIDRKFFSIYNIHYINKGICSSLYKSIIGWTFLPTTVIVAYKSYLGYPKKVVGIFLLKTALAAKKKGR